MNKLLHAECVLLLNVWWENSVCSESSDLYAKNFWNDFENYWLTRTTKKPLHVKKLELKDKRAETYLFFQAFDSLFVRSFSGHLCFFELTLRLFRSLTF